MKSILLGNGINIQFGGKSYSNGFIIKRIIFNARANKYDPLFAGTISGTEIENIFRSFLDIANTTLNGDYDDVGNSDDQEAINDFKCRYNKPFTKYYEIMLEDWFLLIRLFFILNPDIKDQWQSAKQGFEQMILDAIYNEGMLSNIHQSMNKKVKRFFNKFDNIFSLNYDCNIEALTGKDVFHLHGDYSVLADSENPNTVKGYIRQQTGQSIVIEEFKHSYCNALLDYSGELKFKTASNIIKSDFELNHFLEMSKYNEAEYEKQIDILKQKNDNVGRIIRTFINNPSLKSGTNYHFDEFSNLKGELHIIGLSPNNDSHIFRCINESNLDKVLFYYFSKSDKTIPITKPYELLHIGELWKSLDAKRKIYRYAYPISNSPEIDKFIEVFNAISLG